MRTLGTTLIAVALLGLTANTPASAASPWTPYRSEDFTVPAGSACSFEVAARVVADQERYRTTSTYPDGSPRVQEFTGILKYEYTNTATGESVVRNLTGRGDVEYFPDGGFTLTDVGGHFGAVLHPGDDPGPGIYVVGGKGWAVHIDGTTGHRTLTPGRGTIENLCDTLA